jgi:NAD(P)-dependent dehydrogenase (short-subunit alcohol dehydrogenase family)
MEIAETTAIVTGASSGLGAAAARMLAQAGARVALLDINTEAVRALAVELGGCSVRCDVADPRGAEQALEQVVAQVGLPRILVHCAGITIGRVPLTGDNVQGRLASFERLLRINLGGTLNMLSLTAGQMVRLEPQEGGERGVILLTSSIAAFDGQIGMSCYSASKGGVASLVLPAARELGLQGIRVNAVAPGYFDTPMLENVPDYVRAGCTRSFVFPRRYGTCEEFAALVRHLIENQMLNGTTLRLDGGLRMPPTFSP